MRLFRKSIKVCEVQLIVIALSTEPCQYVILEMWKKILCQHNQQLLLQILIGDKDLPLLLDHGNTRRAKRRDLRGTC